MAVRDSGSSYWPLPRSEAAGVASMRIVDSSTPMISRSASTSIVAFSCGTHVSEKSVVRYSRATR
jgi:hypothetical protein